MTDKIRIWFVIVPVLLCGACSSTDYDYFPLQQGYKWRYDVAMTTRDGLEKQRYIINNLGQTELNSQPVYLKQSLDGTILYYAADANSIRFVGSLSDNIPGGEFIAEEQIVMQYPPQIDANWETITETRLLKKTGPPQKTEFKIKAKVPLDVTIESLNETVNVPAGIFYNCLKITMTGSIMKDAGNYVGLTLVNVEETSWYAPEIGLVKLERLETTQSNALDKGTLLVELAEFETG